MDKCVDKCAFCKCTGGQHNVILVEILGVEPLILISMHVVFVYARLKVLSVVFIVKLCSDFNYIGLYIFLTINTKTSVIFE